jgi:Electron transfer DM13
MLLSASCKKENTPAAVDNPPPAGTVLATGSFVSNVHPSSGTVKIIKGADGKISLAIENFSTDNGPDLRIWLATSTSATSYKELGLLKAVSGNFSYDLSADVDYTTHDHVLIWCKDFSVLFGHAVLR